jgi:hypothetical protein
VTEGVEPKNSDRTKALLWELFGSAADEDYLVSRWAGQMGLGYQFYSSAQQATEKYLKCILLMNSKSVKNYGHDLKKLFEEQKDITQKIMPTIFTPPNCFRLNSHHVNSIFEPYISIIDRINQLGNPNNRYRMYSIVFDLLDIHKIDELFFQLRRLCDPLDIDGRDSKKLIRDYLHENPALQPREFKFERSTADHYSKAMEILSFRNFSFFPEDAHKTGRVFMTVSAHNAPISLKLQDPEQHEELRWLLEHAQLNKSDTAAILQHINANSGSSTNPE